MKANFGGFVLLWANSYGLRNSINCIHQFLSLGQSRETKTQSSWSHPFCGIKKKKKKAWPITPTRFFFFVSKGSAEGQIPHPVQQSKTQKTSAASDDVTKPLRMLTAELGTGPANTILSASYSGSLTDQVVFFIPLLLLLFFFSILLKGSSVYL